MFFSSVCLGSSFLLRASKSRWPSLLAKIACSMLIVPILPPVPAAVVSGVVAAALGAAGNAGSALALCARAATEKTNTVARRNRGNFLVMGCLNSLEIVSGISLKIFLTEHAGSRPKATSAPCDQAGKADPPSVSRQLSKRDDHPLPFNFQGAVDFIIGTLSKSVKQSRGMLGFAEPLPL